MVRDIERTRSSSVEHPPGYVDGRLHSTAGHPTVLRTDFDVRAYTHRAGGKLTISPKPVEIDEQTGHDLAFLWRIENGALAETRAVLASWTANEARITAFIATWAVERFWMARAIEETLETAGISLQPRSRPTLAARARSMRVERILPLVAPVVGGIVREPMTAGHMARLAVQEGAIGAAQDALRPRLPSSVQTIMVEVSNRRREMLDFFRSETVARVARSKSEAISARLHLSGGWAPLRVVGVADPDEEPALARIFADPADMTALTDSDSCIGDLFTDQPSPSTVQVRNAMASHVRAPRGRNNDGIRLR